MKIEAGKVVSTRLASVPITLRLSPHSAANFLSLTLLNLNQSPIPKRMPCHDKPRPLEHLILPVFCGRLSVTWYHFSVAGQS